MVSEHVIILGLLLDRDRLTSCFCLNRDLRVLNGPIESWKSIASIMGRLSSFFGFAHFKGIAKKKPFHIPTSLITLLHPLVITNLFSLCLYII